VVRCIVILLCRITLRYGGRDITRTFSWLLDHISFPYIDCQLDTNVLDTLLLQELKHSYCHMDTVSKYYYSYTILLYTILYYSILYSTILYYTTL